MSQSSEPRTVASRVLGNITTKPEHILNFPTGLLGFPETREFTLVATHRQGFYWLQSLEYDTLTFLLIDPFLHVPDFTVDLPDEDMGALGTDATKIVVLGIVTLPAGPDDALTVNLQGPLVLNTESGIGQQLIIPDSPHGTRCALDVGEALLAS